MNKRCNKKGFEFSFAWMFAIIVGIVIIMLAVYASTKILRTGEYQQSSETAKKLTTIFDPLETSTGSSRSGIITLDQEIKLYDDCYTDGNYGRQTISIATKKSFSEEYGEKSAGTEVSNKYIFGEGETEGKDYYYQTESYESPFKVADIIILTTRKYCYIQAPTEVAEEITGLGMKNVKLASNAGECVEGEVRVCFTGTGGAKCDVTVTGQAGSFEEGYITKGTERVNYVGKLIYAGIVADAKNYECNVKRLMMRTGTLANIYLKESQYLSTKGCNTGMEMELSRLSNTITNSYESSIDLITKIKPVVKGIEQNNVCRIW